MKVSQRWLSELLQQELALEPLLERLTLAGLEVDGHDVLSAVEGVVIGHVQTVSQHPDADKLKVCEVNDGEAVLSIVCGAPNVREDMHVAVARIGSKLPGGLKIRRSKLRGVESHGMLCSAAELGLGQDHDGIMDLPNTLTPGTSLADALALPDTVIDIDLTPNRGDCFSMLGVAREVATFAKLAFDEPAVSPVTGTAAAETEPVVATPEAVPVFSTSVVTGIDTSAITPLWMVERLRRCGIRAIHPVVDITNYVMMELGQPMHAYDLDKLAGHTLHARFASGDESLTLLDGRTLTPDNDTLVIADQSGAIGLAGIMGGESTMVDEHSTNILFEAAHFTPRAMAGQARRYNMHTDASLRFERGVDAYGHERAQARAVSLLQEIAGGEAHGFTVKRVDEHLRQEGPIQLRADRLSRMLGLKLDSSVVNDIFERLGFAIQADNAGWQLTPPTWRFDIAIEEDLIEEVARVYGYDRIPLTTTIATSMLASSPETRVSPERLRDTMAGMGYREAITYSFVDPDKHAALRLAPSGPELVNPISKDLSVMRGTLLCGLLDAVRHNMARQQSSVRIFEYGRVFAADGERENLAAVLCGQASPEGWNNDKRAVDVFDIKGDAEALLGMTGHHDAFEFRSATVDGLHPGQTAQIYRGDKLVGVIGALHPAVSADWDIEAPCVVLELDVTLAFAAVLPVAASISKFPKVRRDIALLVEEQIAAEALINTAKAAVPALLRDVIVFDVYQGKGIEPGLKSVALGLILLDSSRTLTDEDSEQAVALVAAALRQQHGAKLRE
ncbi:MAG: phenylalanine--tRNA ligase subunit beta [Pseudomonadota bacterium]